MTCLFEIEARGLAFAHHASILDVDGDALKIHQSALTGEPLPVTEHPGDEVFVIATVHTFFNKAAHLVDSTNNVDHFQKVLTAIGNFCICLIALGMLVEVVVMYSIQCCRYRDGIDNFLVLLIGGRRSVISAGDCNPMEDARAQRSRQVSTIHGPYLMFISNCLLLLAVLVYPSTQ